MTRATTLTAFRTAAPADATRPAAVAQRDRHLREIPPQLGLVVHRDLNEIEADWRRFERTADCTAFQTFDWLSTWHKHVGTLHGVRPAIVAGRTGDGELAFLLPLSVVPERFADKLCWLGQDSCDYNAPLLARDFPERIGPERFFAAWRDALAEMQRSTDLRFDWVEFAKMPQTIGAQANPFCRLPVTVNASGVHLMQLGDDWEKFYVAKRSSATRRRDRAKRRHMSEFGEIRFITAADANDARRTLEILIEQKADALARRGIANIFAPAGHREFFLDLATNPKTRHFVHISRVEIGADCAAANLGIVFGDCYYHVLASFGETPASHYGPGALHLRELMAHAIKLGLKRFDFTIGDEPYKLEWSDTDLKLYDYIETASWRGFPAASAARIKQRIKRFIKQTPLLWHLISDARAAIGSLRRRRAAQAPVRSSSSAASPAAVACVMGDMDLLRPLALAHIPCAVVSRPGVPSLYSRYAQSRLQWSDYSRSAEALVDILISFGKSQAEPPVLFYEEDAQVLLVSRFRARLAEAFRFVVADATLIEDLLDKARFQALAERHGLPVPAARQFNPAEIEPDGLGLPFPIIIKPLTRLDRWNAFWGLRKAVCAENLDDLRALWPRLRAVGLELLAQEFVTGAESRIESYHCYVDQSGGIAGEFTGRKIRTQPAACGHTTALEITDAGDVRECGRAIVVQLKLTGVAKLDFKRDPQGALQLLEINPRFNLWHHPGAIAGVNIPALVYADLTGLPRPPAAPAKAGVQWCRLWKDYPAARAAGMPLTPWLRWVLACEAKSSLSWDDPTPFFRSAMYRLIGPVFERPHPPGWYGRKPIA